ncbi:MAG: type II toxin-antitoxin system VapC family toxin [Chitinophagales bacterium]
MNRYVLDTNILIIYIRDKQIKQFVEEKYHPFDPPNLPLVSIVSVGELKAFALMNKWGNKRLSKIETFLEQAIITDINSRDIINKYAEIDAFSQGRLENKPLGLSARNMGKNDIWIAATASVTDSILLTTDRDFIHLNAIFCQIEKISLASIK